MEIDTAQTPFGSGSSSSAAAYPRWVILEGFCKSNVDSSCCTGVTKALAAAVARTSNGHPIQVSLSLQEPPARSVVLVDFPDGGADLNYGLIMAAHRDSLLVAVNIHQGYNNKLDYFVYNAGDAAGDSPLPPSLLLLPRYHLSENKDDRDPIYQEFGTDCTAILHPRRGEDEDEVVVAELKMVVATMDPAEKKKVAELFMFRSGAWSVQRPWICCGNDDDFGELHSEWTTSSAFPVGDSTLCWADEFSKDGGVLICDLLEESPCLQYVPLPLVPTEYLGRKVCATADGNTLKFVNIFPRCCCGSAGASICQHFHHAYTINTWTLRMDNGMEWVMDGMVDATELWSLDTYKGLPRVPLGYPVVNMYKPHVICFALCESYHDEYGGDKTLWLLIVNMRSKTIQSASSHPDYWLQECDLISSNVSDYLNPYPTCSSHSTSMDQSLTTEMEIEKKKRDDSGTNLMSPSPCVSTMTAPAAQAYDEILAAFREISSYGLAHDDMLKAYAILSCDNSSRVRSLLRLPMKLRKDWLLMEIKTADGDHGGRCFDL